MQTQIIETFQTIATYGIPDDHNVWQSTTWFTNKVITNDNNIKVYVIVYNIVTKCLQEFAMLIHFSNMVSHIVRHLDIWSYQFLNLQ